MLGRPGTSPRGPVAARPRRRSAARTPRCGSAGLRCAGRRRSNRAWAYPTIGPRPSAYSGRLDAGGSVNQFFETGKKATTRRQPGLLLRGLRMMFNLALVLALVLVLCGAIGMAGLYLSVVERYGESLSRTYPKLPQDSYVYDAQGEMIGAFRAETSRQTVGMGGMGEHLPLAVVAVEDRRFYEHLGVDFEGLGRAAWTDLRAWEVQEGGSTISEQLMKNLYVPEKERLGISLRGRFGTAST